MKFVCPVCKTPGNIPDHEGKSDQPAAQTTCLKCGTGLSVELNTGQVQQQSAGKDPQEDRAAPAGRPKYAAESVLSMRPRDKGKKDYLATGVFVIVLGVLIAAGVYFSLNIKADAWNQPLQIISRLVDEVTEHGKNILPDNAHLLCQ